MAKKKIKMPELPQLEYSKKNIIKSKTFWVNAFIALIVPFLPEQFKPIISSPESMSLIFAAINVVLRLLSKDKVTLI